MSESPAFDFDLGGSLGQAQKPPIKLDYLNKLGVPRNPFVTHSDDRNDLGPLYQDHISSQIREINDWIKLAYQGDTRPLSLVGGIGLGKTHLMRLTERLLLARQRGGLNIAVFRESLYGRGSQNVSLGNLLYQKLKEWRPAHYEAPADANPALVPLVWQLVQHEPDEESESFMGRHLATIRRLATQEERAERATLLCRWLERAELTRKQYEQLGESRKIDWEGEFVVYLCDLLNVASKAGICHRVYFMLDQLEDLFRSNITMARRARLMTDLRLLMDEVLDRKAPIALMLAWSTQLEGGDSRRDQDIEQRFGRAYPALLDRIQSGVRVELGMLGEAHRGGFARIYIDQLEHEEGYDLTRIKETLPKLLSTANEFAALAPGGGRQPHEPISPRRWLSCLSKAADQLAQV
jgi:hypothetical protein